MVRSKRSASTSTVVVGLTSCQDRINCVTGWPSTWSQVRTRWGRQAAIRVWASAAEETSPATDVPAAPSSTVRTSPQPSVAPRSSTTDSVDTIPTRPRRNRCGGRRWRLCSHYATEHEVWEDPKPLHHYPNFGCQNRKHRGCCRLSMYHVD